MVCKVILVFRFGPRLGLKTEDLGQAEQQAGARAVSRSVLSEGISQEKVLTKNRNIY